MARKDEAPAISSSDKAYALPSWFLQHNVKTSWDLATMSDQIGFCKCMDCKEMKPADDALQIVDQPDEKPDDLSKKVHYSTFSELRDVICASLTPLQDGKLRRQDSTIVFRMEEDGISLLEPAWMSRVVS